MEDIHIKEKNILQLRCHIKESLLQSFKIDDRNSIQAITIEVVENLIGLYDYYILDNYLKCNINSKIKVSLSRRMTSSGGKTIFYKKGNTKEFEIRISLTILEEYINSDYKGKICGIEGKDVIDGLILIIEHELCHVIEFSAYGTSNCKGRRFKSMAWKLFRHGTSTHEIISKKSSSDKNSINIGEEVSFEHRGEIYFGIIYRINKRATVMVKDPKGQYKDKKGNTFNKWYVPLNMLR